jgi:hypothetical protein
VSLEDEIEEAIHDHEGWKSKLHASIDSGTVSVDAADVGRDDVCPFGRWLYGSTIPKDARVHPDYMIVRYLHSKFHECAVQIVQFISEGKKTDAEALMAPGGKYTKLSNELFEGMVTWKDDVHRKRAKKLNEQANA